jgi:hypothetical protein
MPDPSEASPANPGPCERCTPTALVSDKEAKDDDAQFGRQVKNILRRGFAAYCFQDDGKRWVRELK